MTNRPFQAWGRLTRKFVSEPGSGEIVPRTRQKVGTGGVAATWTAEVSVVPGGTVSSGKSAALHGGAGQRGRGRPDVDAGRECHHEHSDHQVVAGPHRGCPFLSRTITARAFTTAPPGRPRGLFHVRSRRVKAKGSGERRRSRLIIAS